MPKKKPLDVELVVLSFISSRPEGATVGDVEAAFERPIQNTVQALYDSGYLARHEGCVYSVSSRGRIRLLEAQGVTS